MNEADEAGDASRGQMISNQQVLGYPDLMVRSVASKGWIWVPVGEALAATAALALSWSLRALFAAHGNYRVVIDPEFKPDFVILGVSTGITAWMSRTLSRRSLFGVALLTSCGAVTLTLIQQIMQLPPDDLAGVGILHFLSDVLFTSGTAIWITAVAVALWGTAALRGRIVSGMPLALSLVVGEIILAKLSADGFTSAVSCSSTFIEHSWASRLLHIVLVTVSFPCARRLAIGSTRANEEVVACG